MQAWLGGSMRGGCRGQCGRGRGHRLSLGVAAEVARGDSRDLFLKLVPHDSGADWMSGVKERTVEAETRFWVCLTWRVERPFSVGKGRFWQAEYQEFRFVHVRRRTMLSELGLKSETRSRAESVGRGEGPGRVPGALDPEVRGKGRSQPRVRGQAVGQKPGSCRGTFPGGLRGLAWGPEGWGTGRGKMRATGFSAKSRASPGNLLPEEPRVRGAEGSEVRGKVRRGGTR